MSGALIRIRRNVSSAWASLNPILESGEQGLETDTRRVRIGDGSTRFVELDYYLPSESILALVDQAISNAGAGDGGAAQAALTAHINSLTPHSVYDDGPSLLLFYENAKV
jgi:hypothetical protein